MKSEGMLTEMRQCRDEASQSLTTEERRLQRLLDAYEAGAIDLSELTERSQRVRTRIERASQRKRPMNQGWRADNMGMHAGPNEQKTEESLDKRLCTASARADRAQWQE